MILSRRTHVNAAFWLLFIASISSATVATPATNTALSPGLQRESLETADRQTTSCNSGPECPDEGVCVNEAGRCEEKEGCNGICNIEAVCTIDQPCPEGQTCLRTVSDSSPMSYTSCFPDSEVDALSDFAKPVAELESEENQGTDENQESDENPCIAIDMLRGFSAHELVFEKHVLARVLCDTTGSCATRGHVVNYHGRAMMMGSYCDIVGCEERVMKVNSPKYRRGLKVRSPSKDMHFTAFAARYGTIAEEAVLATAVRLGL